MLPIFRPALLFCAALSASTIAPAQDPLTKADGQSIETSVPFAAASLPKISVPELLNTQGEPQLTDSHSNAAQDQDDGTSEATAPAVKASGDLTEMVSQLRSADAGSHELNCLATGIYFESKGEPLAGQLAVGRVIANRTRSGGRFPSTYCGVLFQHGQFSFVHGGRLPAVSHSNRQWQTAVALAKIVDENLQQSSVGDALFFHARYVSPGWHAKRVASIGNHIFYR